MQRWRKSKRRNRVRSRKDWFGLAVTIAQFLALAVPCINPAHAAGADPKTVRTWKAKCASCHGAEGKGDTEQGAKMKLPDMTKPEWQKENSDEKMRQAILNGVKKEGKEGMDSYKDVLSPEQVDALIAYVRSLGVKG
jgi:mono/diheme cytochrome c family protein